MAANQFNSLVRNKQGWPQRLIFFSFLAQIVNRCERSQNASACAFPNAPHSSLSNHHKLTHGRDSTELKASRLPNTATPGLVWCVFSLSSVGPAPPPHTHTHNCTVSLPILSHHLSSESQHPPWYFPTPQSGVRETLSKKVQPGLGQWIKCSPCKRTDLNLHPQTPCKKL